MMTPLGYLPLKDAVERCCEVWGGDPKTSYERLRPYLDALEIKTLAKFDNGADKNIGHGWASYLNDDAHLDGKLKFNQGDIDGPYGLPAFVHRDELEIVLGLKPRPLEKASTPSSNVTPRSAKVGSDSFWLEACRLIFTGECSPDENTQPEFVQKLMEWMNANRPGLYKESYVEDKVKAIWKTLKPRG